MKGRRVIVIGGEVMGRSDASKDVDIAVKSGNISHQDV